MNSRSSSQTTLGVSAPVWVPDTFSNSCQECGVRFSFVQRKHHCRGCGRLLCGRCSQYQAPLQYLGGALGRVCLACHNQIQNNRHNKRDNMRRTKSLNDFDKMKENISKLIRSQQLAAAESEEDQSLESSCCLISVVPLELMAKILELLPFQDIKQCRLVNSFWLSAVSLTNFYKRSQVNLPEWLEDKVETLRALDNSNINNFKLHNFPFDGPDIPLTSPTILLLKDCQITSSELMKLLPRLSGLRSLGLINCKQLFMSGTFLSNQAEREMFQETLQGLESIQLDHNTYLSDVLLLRICRGLSSLKELSLESCNIMNHQSGIVTRLHPECDLPASSSVLTWRIVVRIIQNIPSLTSLSLANNTGITIEDLCHCENLKLENLNISGCSSVSTEGFLQLVQAHPSLVRLNVANSRKILSCLKEQTEDIFNALKSVRYLDISETSIPYLRYLSSLPQLQDIIMNHIDSPGAEICEALTSNGSPPIQSFKSRNLSLSNSKLLMMLSQRKLSGLVHLELPDCAEGVMDDPVMSLICDNLPHLQHLDLSGNSAITDIGTLGLLQDNIATNRDALKGKMLLGSRAEIEMVLERKRQNYAVELMSGNEKRSSSPGKPPGGINKLNRLRHLDLSGTSISSLSLSHGLQCPDLRTLHLSDCRGGLVSEEGLTQAARSHPRLHQLSLSASCLTDLGLIELVSHLPRLDHLDIRRCKAITSGVLPPLTGLAPNLSTLLISGCSGIHPDAVKSLVPHFKYIKRIDL